MNIPRCFVLVGMILVAAVSRLVPHPPNFSPIAAMALFAGASFASKRLAFAVPFAALLLSDAVLGFYRGVEVVYGSFALIVCLGLWLRRHRNAAATASIALAGSVLFFVLTNFGVWWGSGLYPRTGSGLMACYVAAIPFFRHTVVGDLSYALVLFGGLAVAERYFAAVREPTPAAR